ncbi:MAG: histidine kinase N-terminal 7TM domain-containing protein [bacterium]
MDYRIFSLFLILFIYIVFGFLVFLKGQEKNAKNTYSFFILNLIIWTTSIIMFYRANDFNVALFWSKFLYLAGNVIAASFLYFSFAIEGENIEISLNKKVMIFLPCIILLPLYFFTPIILKKVGMVNGSKGFIYGPGHLLFDIPFNLEFLLGLYRLAKIYKFSTGIRKAKLWYILSGTTVGFFLAGIFNVLLPWFNRFEFLWLGPICAISVIPFTSYAIIRYRLMDINIVIREATIHALSTLAISTVFILLGLQFFSKPVFIILLFSATLLSSLTQEPIKRLLRPIIFGAKFEYQKTISNYSQELALV